MLLYNILKFFLYGIIAVTLIFKRKDRNFFRKRLSQKIENKEFAMALFEYAPCDNWSAFFEAGYFFEFDAASSGDIRAFQLEIKDDIRNKVIDRTLQVSCEEEHFRIWIPSTTRDSTAWKKISQVCFVVFFNSTYIDGEKGLLTIRNLKMVPR